MVGWLVGWWVVGWLFETGGLNCLGHQTLLERGRIEDSERGEGKENAIQGVKV